MTLHGLVVAMLALAALLGMLRTGMHWRAAPGTARGWRWSVLLLAQPLLVVLLYVMLHPPRMDAAPADTLTVLTAGADARVLAAQRERGRVVALPEAPAMPGIERVPDLGTALRRHPQSHRIRVLGEGLLARDRDAARGVAVEAALAPLPRGLARLDVPPRIATGAVFAVPGHVDGLAAGSVELLDPADRRIDAAPLEADGGFVLRGIAFAAGAVEFGLRVLDGEGAVTASHDVPLWIDDEAPLRVLLLAGAPNPETRALRRWMQDAGFDVQARIALGAGMQVADSPVASMTDQLHRHDVLVVDSRAWQGLGDGGRARVMDAVADGLGLLLRADMPLPAAALRPLRADGFDIAGGSATSPFRLPPPRVADDTVLRARLGVSTADVSLEAGESLDIPELARRVWRVTGSAAATIPRNAQGEPPGAWRAHGQGRVAVWTPLDTWRLPLLGRRDLHAELWSEAIATVARTHVVGMARIAGELREGGRVEVCGAGADTVVESPGGERFALLPDPGAGGCAAYWPNAAGWHRLQHGGRVQPFHVLAADASPGLRASATRDATLLLASRPVVVAAADHAPAASSPRGSPWPWFAAWLALAAALWWFERSKLGVRVAARQDADR